MVKAVLLALAICGGLSTSATAAGCRLALVLALDISSSVDAAEDRLQRGGLAAALLAPEVKQALFSTDATVALSVFEWSGRFNQELLLDWTHVDTPDALARASQVIASSARSHREFPTAMGHALEFAHTLTRNAPRCDSTTIDVAGDGSNNEGPSPREVYKVIDFSAITVNGLVVNAAEFESEAQLVAFYRNDVLNGPGAFLEVAQGFTDYERAMRRKLERELRPPAIGSFEADTGRKPG